MLAGLNMPSEAGAEQIITAVLENLYFGKRRGVPAEPLIRLCNYLAASSGTSRTNSCRSVPAGG